MWKIVSILSRPQYNRQLWIIMLIMFHTVEWQLITTYAVTLHIKGESSWVNPRPWEWKAFSNESDSSMWYGMKTSLTHTITMLLWFLCEISRLFWGKNMMKNDRPLIIYMLKFAKTCVRILWLWCYEYRLNIRYVNYIRQIWGHHVVGNIAGPRLDIKTVLSTYGDFHVKDKTS